MKILDLAFEQKIDDTEDYAINKVIDLVKQIPGISSEDIFKIADSIADYISGNQKMWYKNGFKDGVEFTKELKEVCCL